MAWASEGQSQAGPKVCQLEVGLLEFWLFNICLYNNNTCVNTHHVSTVLCGSNADEVSRPIGHWQSFWGKWAGRWISLLNPFIANLKGLFLVLKWLLHWLPKMWRHNQVFLNVLAKWFGDQDWCQKSVTMYNTGVQVFTRTKWTPVDSTIRWDKLNRTKRLRVAPQ